MSTNKQIKDDINLPGVQPFYLNIYWGWSCSSAPDPTLSVSSLSCESQACFSPPPSYCFFSLGLVKVEAPAQQDEVSEAKQQGEAIKALCQNPSGFQRTRVWPSLGDLGRTKRGRRPKEPTRQGSERARDSTASVPAGFQ